MKIRWGMIGCGEVTEVKSAPAYKKVKGFSIDAVMSRHADKAKDYAQRHEIPVWYDNADALINDPDIDAIYIATPPDSHCELALKVAAVNKICCVEKPMAMSFEECEAMQLAFAQKHLPLFVAYYRRSLAGFQQIKKWLQEGEIGEPRSLSWRYLRPASHVDLTQQANWRTQVNVAPLGYVDDIGSHGLDIFHYLFGPVAKVKAIKTNQQDLYTAPDAVETNLLFASGLTGAISWNFATFSEVDKVTVEGSQGTISFSIFQDSDAILLNSHGQQITSMCKPSPIQQRFVQDMADAIFENTPHPSTAESAMHTNWVMQEIARAC